MNVRGGVSRPPDREKILNFRAAMKKMEYTTTGDLLPPRVTRVPYPDPGFWWTLVEIV